jgi:hypothetical protein
MIKSWMIIWARHAACRGDMKKLIQNLVGKPEAKRSFERYGTDEQIILKWI